MRKLFVFLALSLLICTSCGGDDGGSKHSGPSGSSPVISDLQCPQTTLDRGQGGGVFTVQDCSVEFIDQDEDLETILETPLYSAQECGEAPLSEISIDVRSQTVGEKQGTILFDARVQTNCVAGTYTYEFSGLDSKSNESNQSLLLQFELVEP